MPLAIQDSQDSITLAAALAQEFAKTAVERDIKGGTPKQERDHLRQSGLLKLIIPKHYGGLGESWITTLKIVREFAKVDSSIAHLLGYHQSLTIIPHLYGTAEQKEKYYIWTARNNWFWGNALNRRYSDVTLTSDGKNYRLNGTKRFCSGAKDSDMLAISAVQPGRLQPVVVTVPTISQGIYIQDDWDNIGQRQTDSGSVTFTNVLVKEQEILTSPLSLAHPFAALRTYIAQLVRINIFLGLALGAFEQAKQYTVTTSKPWPNSGVEKVTQDPYILQIYGQLWIDLTAAISLAEQAADKLQTLWQKETQLTVAECEDCAIAITAASAFTTRVGLEVANQMFEVMGATATATRYRFDRYWRNLRTLTLHDPIAYKIRDVGKWALNNEFSLVNPYT